MLAAYIARRRPADARLGWGVVALLWVIASGALASGRLDALSRTATRPAMLLVRAAGARPDLCGLAVHDVEYWSAGHAILGRAVPIYYPSPYHAENGAPILMSARAYNFIVAPTRWARLIPPDYRAVQCAEGGGARLCLYRRTGGCDPAAGRAVLLQHMLERSGL